jgi:hypothetical protein
MVEACKPLRCHPGIIAHHIAIDARSWFSLYRLSDVHAARGRTSVRFTRIDLIVRRQSDAGVIDASETGEDGQFRNSGPDWAIAEFVSIRNRPATTWM